MEIKQNKQLTNFYLNIISKLVLIIFASFLVIGCKTYVQVIETSSDNTDFKNKIYVYENDTLKISYDFWAEKGLMSFSVFNKSAKPIFIDWKKSSYINNDVKLNYWEDEERSEMQFYYSLFYYLGNPLNPSGGAISSGTSRTVKIERKTFVPPKAKYQRAQFIILPNYYFDIKEKISPKLIKYNRNPKKKTKVYEMTIPKSKSPLIFRNFLTVSFSENFESEFYVDNEFYISKITEMERKHFEQDKINEKGDVVYSKITNKPIKVSKFKKGNSFYIRMPREAER